MSDVEQKWLEAAKVLAVDPIQKVECPSCGAAYLEVVDVEPERVTTVFERHLICRECNASNSIRMHRKDNDGSGGG